MLRAIIERKTKHLSGAEFVTYKTVDFECDAIEQQLSGGLDEDNYDVPTVIGIEVVASPQVQHDEAITDALFKVHFALEQMMAQGDHSTDHESAERQKQLAILHREVSKHL